MRLNFKNIISHQPLGGGASVRREWMSSTASVSSTYRKEQILINPLVKFPHTPVVFLRTSRTKASFFPWDRSSSDSSSELSEWERKSLDRCLGSGIGEPTTSSVSSCRETKRGELNQHGNHILHLGLMVKPRLVTPHEQTNTGIHLTFGQFYSIKIKWS